VFLLFEQLDGETQFDAFPEGALKEFVQRKSTLSLSLSIIHHTLATHLLTIVCVCVCVGGGQTGTRSRRRRGSG
jgi:hypothetical protein